MEAWLTISRDCGQHLTMDPDSNGPSYATLRTHSLLQKDTNEFNHEKTIPKPNNCTIYTNSYPARSPKSPSLILKHNRNTKQRD